MAQFNSLVTGGVQGIGFAVAKNLLLRGDRVFVFDYLPENIHHMDSYEVKWIYDNPKSKIDPLVCPAKINKELENKIKETALKTFKVLDCKDWARIDIRMDKHNVPNVLEVNALPGFIKDPRENSRLPRAAYAQGWSYEKLTGEVLKSAIRRWNLKHKFKHKV